MVSVGDTAKDFRLVHDVAQAVADAETLEEALNETVELVCKRSEWLYGEVWTPDGDVLVASDVWYGEGEGFEAFRDATERLRFTEGVGLPGRVWETHEMEWISDVSRADLQYFLRASAAEKAGFRAALGVPILDGERFVAVIIFFLGEPKETDPRLVALVSTIAILGGLYSRKRRVKELADEHRHLTKQFEANPVGVMVFDPDGTVVDANPQAAKVLGVELDELLNEQYVESSFELFDQEGRAIPENEMVVHEVVMTQKTLRGRQLGVHTPSGDRWLLVNAAPVKGDGETVEQVIVVLEDLTSRYSWEQEIERQNERLSRFASAVSHDLRTPLSTAAAALELAKRDTDNEHLETVGKCLQRMDVIVTDVLTLAQEGKRVISPEHVSLATVAGKAWEDVSPPNATLQVLGGATVMADEERLQRLLDNLFRNSLEHGRNDVTVRVGTIDGEGFFVEDDGPGIPEAEREKVFQTGYTTGESGTGFGLAIVREIADAHDWEVNVTESESGGARFEIRTRDV
ncbi:ATP-binding protein [Haloarchaeobius sp. TZWWS8]|uniref:sensor histidine kinase n=1 Tax=Haloarchaeobius sp. TZWWS8 TaxID=3446121 RepID=UPI003EB7D87F